MPCLVLIFWKEYIMCSANCSNCNSNCNTYSPGIAGYKDLPISNNINAQDVENATSKPNKSNWLWIAGILPFLGG